MEGWPAGWVGLDEGTERERFESAGAEHVLYGVREQCRRAAWAVTGGAPAVDREALAMALIRAAFSGNSALTTFCEEDMPRWLRMADEAIRLLSFKPSVGRAEPRARIEELERANAALTATTNAALERAKEAEDEWDEMLTRHTLDLAAALGYANGAHFGELLAIVGQRTAAMDERDNRIGALIETAKAAAARAEEAQMRAQKAEEALLYAESDGSTVARVRALVGRAQQDRETERLRRALDAMARGVAHMADAVSEMVGGEEGAP